MFKGIVFILLLGLVILLVIVAIVVSVVYRIAHRVKKVLNGENPDVEDDYYNPEIGKKHRHYAHKAYSSSQQSYSQGYQSQGEHVHETETGEILYETRNPEEVNRQIFAADEGEYVEFSEES